MNMTVYRGLSRLLGPALWLRSVWRYRDYPDQRRARAQRWGYVTAPPTAGSVVWLHAASVGEARAVAPLLQALLDEGHCVHVTTNTPTGWQAVHARFGDAITQSYPPLDTPGAVNRFLDRLRPAAAIRVELELWPNLLNALQARGIPSALVNARLSERSLSAYQRLGGLMEQVLGCVDWVGAQSQADGQRLQALGLPAQRLEVTGNLKFDQPVDQTQVEAGQQWRARFAAERPVWVAASVRDGESEFVLEAHARLLERYPEALLLLVPRHPERFQWPALPQHWGQQATRRRSQGDLVGPQTTVLLGDTMGELTRYLAAADVVFMGGSLVPVGGHNPLEAAALGLPITMGTHVFNFAEVDALLAAAGGRYQVSDAAELAATLVQLFDDAKTRRQVGARARTVVDAHRGAAERSLRSLNACLNLAALQ